MYKNHERRHSRRQGEGHDHAGTGWAGRRADGRGDWPGAEALLRQHRARAEAERNEERALALCSELMGLYRQWGREKSFQDVLERTMVLLETVRPEPVSRGTILINAATGLAAFGENRRALALFQEAWHCYRTG